MISTRPFFRLLAIAFLVLLNSLIGVSQSKEFHGNFDIYSTKNGLSQNDVRCVFQDSFGFIWIGTYDGLNRFDGYSFRTYQKSTSDAVSLSSNLVSCIAEDKHGNLWIGTDDRGISILERKTEKFINLSSHIGDINALSDNKISSILIDNNETVWIGTGKGLNRIEFDFESKTSKIDHLVADENNPHSISNDLVNSVFDDKFGNIWVGTNAGLNRYIRSEKGEHQFILYENTEYRSIRHITCNDTSLLITTPVNLIALPYSEMGKTNPAIKLVKNVSYESVISDRNGNIWGINLSGAHVNYMENGVLRTHHFQNNWADPHSLSQNITASIIEDQSGMIWIGTNGGGINLYNPKRKNFMGYKRNSSPKSLSYNKVRSIKEDSKGNLWIGTEGGGLNFLSHETPNQYNNNFDYVNINQNHGNFIFSLETIVFKNKEKIFVGTGYPTFLEVIEVSESGEIEANLLQDLSIKRSVFSTLQDSEKYLWAGTYDGGLYRIKFTEEGNYDSHYLFKHNNADYSSISSNIIRSLAEDQSGNIWIGTDKGVNKVTTKEKYSDNPNVIRYTHNPEDTLSISYDYILPIFVSNDSNVWIGTLGGGLNKLIPGTTPTNDRFERINDSHGLPNNVIKSIEEDSKGNLWIGSNGGLSRLNIKSKQVINYGLTDGLQDPEFSEIASTTRANGEMIFGGVDGFNVFDPDEITSDSTLGNVVFTELQVLNQIVNTGEVYNDRVILTESLNRIKSIELLHGENSFSLSFAALHFASPEKNKYEYKLKGFDSEWIKTSAQNRVAKYTNLAPGDYTFYVRASNSDNIWNKEPIALQISIAPPIWMTNIAIGVYIFLTALALWFFRKYTIITNTRKNQLLIEHLEREKVEELSQLKLRFFTNISHEFRTPLTLILGLIERLKDLPSNISENEILKYYDKIHRNSQVLLNLVNQLLDFRKVEQGKMEINVCHGNIGEYIEGLCGNFNELARKKRIEFHFICETSMIGYYDRDIIERIMFNMLSNAFKFTEEEGEITVSLEEDKDSDHLKLQISDTGVGMSKEVQQHLFERFSHAYVKKEHGSGIGLSYTKGLVELYHGHIDFQSKQNVGTSFFISFPYKKEAFENDTIVEENTETKADPQKDVDWILDIEQSNSEHNNGRKKKEFKVLFVEDNEDILFYLEDHFKSSYEIVTANDGSKALEVCLNNHIDLVVSDVMMPVMTGLEFCEKLKDDDRINHIPVILLTAKKSPDDKVRSYEKGADAYISKPFNMAELEARMEALISSRQKLLKKLRKNVDLSPSEVEVTSLDEKFLKRVMSYIEENIGMTEFTVDMLARECGMSQIHLNKKLKVLVGQTANAFIRSVRLKRAAQLLSKNRYSVNEVMYEVGFIDAKYFRTCFKNEFGKTPSEYQKINSVEAD
ncbi:MAG: response regulator [Cyclobacteriaceae bacterium]